MLTWKVGSSSANRLKAAPTFSWSERVFGSMAIDTTGSGKFGGSSSITATGE